MPSEIYGYCSVKHWIPNRELQNAWGRFYWLDGSVSRRETSWEAPSRMPQSRSLKRLAVDLLVLFLSELKWHFSFEVKNLTIILMIQRPYVCSIDDCQASYRRKDHLTRHLLQHKGKTFKCSIKDCNRDFALQGNMTRHVNKFHNGNSSPAKVETQKQHECPEIGCGKVFKFASRLQKHENCHGKFPSI